MISCEKALREFLDSYFNDENDIDKIVNVAKKIEKARDREELREKYYNKILNLCNDYVVYMDEDYTTVEQLLCDVLSVVRENILKQYLDYDEEKDEEDYNPEEWDDEDEEQVFTYSFFAGACTIAPARYSGTIHFA